jgi:ethanolamine kinase
MEQHIFVYGWLSAKPTAHARSFSVCRYPNKQQQELFFRHYLAQEQQQLAAATAAAAGASPESEAAAAAEPPTVDPEVLDRLSAEANVWALASHLYWGVWAIIQACNSPIDFDYMQFSATRLGEFRRRKDEFLSEARKVFGGADDAAAEVADV